MGRLCFGHTEAKVPIGPPRGGSEQAVEYEREVQRSPVPLYAFGNCQSMNDIQNHDTGHKYRRKRDPRSELWGSHSDTKMSGK